MSLEKMYSSRPFKAMMTLLVVVSVFILPGCESVQSPIGYNDRNVSTSYSQTNNVLATTKLTDMDKSLSKLGIQRVEVSEEVRAKLQVKKFSSLKEAQAYIEEANRSLNFERKGQVSAVKRKEVNPGTMRIVPWGMQPPGDFKYYEEMQIGYGLVSQVRFSFDVDFNSQTNTINYSNLSTFVTGFPIGWSWQQRYISMTGPNHFPEFTIHGVVNWGVQIGGLNIYYSQAVTVIVSYDQAFGISNIRSFFGTPTQTNP